MTTTDPNESSFNAEYVELVWGEADSVSRRLEQLEDGLRSSAAVHANAGNDADAATLRAKADAYGHAVSMLDLAFSQALARVAGQVTA